MSAARLEIGQPTLCFYVIRRLQNLVVEGDDVFLGHLTWVARCADIGDGLLGKGRDVGLCDAQFAEVLWNAYEL